VVFCPPARPKSGTQVTCCLCAILIILRQLHRVGVVLLAPRTRAFPMELLLNLCWFSLLLPAWLLWRQRTSPAASGGSTGRPAVCPIAFVCALGCVLILLFPVISASDDLHAMRPEMEESERAFRHPGHCGCTIHALVHSPHAVLTSSVSHTPALEPVGTVLLFIPATIGTFADPVPAGRAPPSDSPTSL